MTGAFETAMPLLTVCVVETDVGGAVGVGVGVGVGVTAGAGETGPGAEDRVGFGGTLMPLLPLHPAIAHDTTMKADICSDFMIQNSALSNDASLASSG